ncbi:MAG: DUF2029 domain-containing protein [Rhodobacteraceae bacterium]|nr:DUF2029 domain-containing protein [Paracoccaceae bacterium]
MMTFSLTPLTDRLIAVSLLSVWTLFVLFQLWGFWPPDLAAIYIAGHLWQTGQTELIYAAPPGFFGGPADSWLPVIYELGGRTELETAFPYVYPPLWAVLTAPLTPHLGFNAFSNLVALVQMPLLSASVLLAARLFRPANLPLAGWSLAAVCVLFFSLQSLMAIVHNQPTVTVIFLILLCFDRLDRGQDRVAGAVLALAAAIKLWPVAFAVILLLDRRWRALAAFALAGAALGLLSIVLAGWPMHRAFLDMLGLVKEAGLLSVANISLVPVIMTGAMILGLADPVDFTNKIVVFRDVPVWLGPLLLALGAAYFVALSQRLRQWPAPDRRAMLVFALSILVPLFGPLGWSHYYLLPLFMLPGLVARLPKREMLGFALGAALISIEDIASPITDQPVAAAVYTLVGCAFWLWVLWRLYRYAGEAGRQPA